jgi:hypothetical protein
MVTHADEAPTLSNPRLLAAVYFSALAIIFTLTIDTLIYLLGIDQLIPLFKAIILAVLVAGGFGMLFGKRIIYSVQPYKKHVFWTAFLMTTLAIPVYNIGFVYLLHETHGTLFVHSTFMYWLTVYFIVLIYSFIVAGIWIAILTGLAAIFLRGHLVYYLLHSLNTERDTPVHSTHDDSPLEYTLDNLPKKTHDRT